MLKRTANPFEGRFAARLLALLAVAGLAFVRKKGAAGDSGPWPFHARKPLSVPEQILYFRLLEALPEHIVLAQVGLSRILGVNKGNNFQAWHNRMSADFVVCRTRRSPP